MFTRAWVWTWDKKETRDGCCCGGDKEDEAPWWGLTSLVRVVAVTAKTPQTECAEKSYTYTSIYIYMYIFRLALYTLSR